MESLCFKGIDYGGVISKIAPCQRLTERYLMYGVYFPITNWRGSST